MVEQSPQEQPPQEPTNGLLGFFKAIVQIVSLDNVPENLKLLVSAMIALVAFGVLTVLSNNSSTSLIGLFIFILGISPLGIQFVDRLFSNVNERRSFSISFFVYEESSKPKKPIANASIELRTRHTFEVVTNLRGQADITLEREYRGKIIDIIVKAPNFEPHSQAIRFSSEIIEIPLAKQINKNISNSHIFIDREKSTPVSQEDVEGFLKAADEALILENYSHVHHLYTEVLKVDPYNEIARNGRVDAMTKWGYQALASRIFRSANHYFTLALTYDLNSTEAKKGKIETLRQWSNVAFMNGELALAHERTMDLLALDPDNIDAKRLLENIKLQGYR